MQKKLNKKRVLALIMSIGLILSLLVSSAYIVANVDHDCIGHDCNICEHIAIVRTLMGSFALLSVFMLLLFTLEAHRGRYFRNNKCIFSGTETLVALKVRLNN